MNYVEFSSSFGALTKGWTSIGDSIFPPDMWVFHDGKLLPPALPDALFSRVPLVALSDASVKEVEDLFKRGACVESDTRFWNQWSRRPSSFI